MVFVLNANLDGAWVLLVLAIALGTIAENVVPYLALDVKKVM